jgi:hypothetical protein
MSRSSSPSFCCRNRLCEGCDHCLIVTCIAVFVLMKLKRANTNKEINLLTMINFYLVGKVLIIHCYIFLSFSVAFFFTFLLFSLSILFESSLFFHFLYYFISIFFLLFINYCCFFSFFSCFIH